MTWEAVRRARPITTTRAECVDNAPQHLLEPVILDAARRRGADIRFSPSL